MRVEYGKVSPLGATWDGTGTNFAVYSSHAQAVDLCLFDSRNSAQESKRIHLAKSESDVWNCFVPGVGPGRAYGFRAYGPYEPKKGLRFNPAKLLLDPYARTIAGPDSWDDVLLDYDPSRSKSDLVADTRDSAIFAPRSIVTDPRFDWKDDAPPGIPLEKTVIYECHIKGLTYRHPDLREKIRGTYLGLCSEPIVEHLIKLGITAVELLPVHKSVTESRLSRLGLTNYWGYNTIGYFAPDDRFVSGHPGQEVNEFKTMVRRLHRAGIEVILDVVYNHTGESDDLGPALFLRGLDNSVYYRLDRNDPSKYVNDAGCGNTLNAGHPVVQSLITDSLYYWVQEMHVDGFRFDLATVLMRDQQGEIKEGNFLSNLTRDPLLSKVKLIAEPWDLGFDGYRFGRMPRGFSEWNDTYRDTVRRFWRCDMGQVGPLATRLSGSSDVFESQGRKVQAGINYVTCHDGFTLRDLVSYKEKHNLANKEDNRDGRSDNLSLNCGAEGATDNPDIVRARYQMIKNHLATLVFSFGVPMLQQGDELGRSQQGNNNAYCQDSELTWVDWNLDSKQKGLIDFVRNIFAIRRRCSAFCRQAFFTGKPAPNTNQKDIAWLKPDGSEMTDREWCDPQYRILGMLISNASAIASPSPGAVQEPYCFLLLLNASDREVGFALPRFSIRGRWTSGESTENKPRPVEGAYASLGPNSLRVLLYELS
jgi:isoamylase